jgi:integrase
MKQTTTKKGQKDMQLVSKASKGTVGIEGFRDRLRLNLPRQWFDGQQKRLALGLPDTPENRAKAQEIAKRIERDALCDNLPETYDGFKVAYLPNHHLTVIQSIQLPKAVKLLELWNQFLEFKRSQCSENTMDTPYRTYTNYLNECPYKDVSEAGEIRDWLLRNKPIESSRRCITRLSAMCDYGIRRNLIKENPFQGMATEIKSPKSTKRDEEEDINPFSVEERDLIIEAFRDNRFCSPKSGFKHSFYADYVEFCFLTGCRNPSESTALQWNHIAEGFSYIHFQQAIIWTKNGKITREGLKTQQNRKFPCNGKLRALLERIKPSTVHPESLVFPGFKGGLLDANSFRKNAWEQIIEGLEIERRTPYQMRHTCATLMSEAGLADKDISRLLGNKPGTLNKHYLGKKRDLVVPEI